MFIFIILQVYNTTGMSQLKVEKQWKLKILRKLHCSVKHQNDWRIRNNDKLQVMYRKRNIVTTTNARRLELVGHVVRMSTE